MGANLENISVLIVDDNSHMINIVKTILRGFGIKSYFEANDAAEAFDIVRSDGPDVIVVDFQMDLLDGTDFVRLVRTGEDIANPFVPIIMLSAHSEKKRVVAARDAGITEFCRKPVTAQDLYKKFCSIINAPRQFVRTATYFGPDRRRHTGESYTGPMRRKDDDSQKGRGDNVSEAPDSIKTLDFT
jgi:two-component system, chemotaxis family, chemotaxis protein CheY